jgi:hypothetical protein
VGILALYVFKKSKAEAFEDRHKPYATVVFQGRMGNQLFQVATLLGYAERTGHIPVLLSECLVNNGVSKLDIRDFFPDIPIVERKDIPELKEINEERDNNYTFVDLPAFPNNNVILHGYFQTQRYFPSKPLNIRVKRPKHTHERMENHDDWGNTFFLHVRRGDYTLPQNSVHNVDLTNYYIEAIKRQNSKHTCFVVSDDIEWCKASLPSMLTVWLGNWLWCPETVSDAETMYWMTQCKQGGICANSTFSWWAGYFLHNRGYGPVYMPRPWGKPDMPPRRDLYPEWAIVLGNDSI